MCGSPRYTCCGKKRAKCGTSAFSQLNLSLVYIAKCQNIITCNPTYFSKKKFLGWLDRSYTDNSTYFDFLLSSVFFEDEASGSSLMEDVESSS